MGSIGVRPLLRSYWNHVLPCSHSEIYSRRVLLNTAKLDSMPHRKRVFTWHDLPHAARDRDQLREDLQNVGFQSQYTHVRAFHACCPRDVWEYFRIGLRPLSRRAAVRTARTLFLGQGTPPITEHLLHAALDELLPDRLDGRVYVGIDDRELLEDCGHYLMYGSEALAGVAAMLTKRLGWNVQCLLASLGTPTVLVVDVPCTRVSMSDLQELSSAIIDELGCEAVPESSVIDFTLTIEGFLPRTAVVSCYSVPRIANASACQEYVRDPKEQGWCGQGTPYPVP